MDLSWNKLGAEFVGTLALVTIGGSAILSASPSDAGLKGAIAFGLALTAIVMVAGGISGAHVNPAVSLGLAVRGDLEWSGMFQYWIAQVLGALLGVALLTYMFGDIKRADTVGPATRTDMWKTIITEAVFTFFLVLTVLMLAGKKNKNAALGIGFVLVACLLAAAGVSGGSLNPARSLTMLFTENSDHYIYYLIGPLIGGLVAGLLAGNVKC